MKFSPMVRHVSAVGLTATLGATIATWVPGKAPNQTHEALAPVVRAVVHDSSTASDGIVASEIFEVVKRDTDAQSIGKRLPIS